jgi:DnaD/phage-associated family protein
MKERMEGFSGFPAGKVPTTPVPNQFFSELLPLIDDLAELKVTLHLLWCIGQKRQGLRYARLEELLGDERLLEGLATKRRSGEAALREGLERAVARGTLLHAVVERDGQTEEWYMLNAPKGRQVIEKLRAGELGIVAELAEDVQLRVERPNIFVLYEQNIGLLTPMIADELRDAERQYPEDWIRDAFREAVSLNKRNWRYILRILERWRTEGKDSGTGGPHEPPTDGEARRKYYIPDGYEDVIEH